MANLTRYVFSLKFCTFTSASWGIYYCLIFIDITSEFLRSGQKIFKLQKPFIYDKK